MPSSSARPADFIILSTPRSGSNNLQDALDRHPEIDCGGELFNPSHVQIRSRVYQEERMRGWVKRAGATPLFALARGFKRQFPRAVLGVARRPPGKPLFGFRLFGGHISYFGLDPFLDELSAHGTRFVHLVRHDTFEQAVSLVRAQLTGVWKRRTGAAAPEPPIDLLALTDRVAAATKELHADKIVSARAARRYDALLVRYEEYTSDDRSYDRIQQFLGVSAWVRLAHANLKSPPVDAETYRTLRVEVGRRGAPLLFDLDSIS